MTITHMFPAAMSDALQFFGFGLSNRYRAADTIEAAPAPTLDGYRRITPADLTGPEPLYVTREVMGEIEATVGAMPAEQGGMFGGTRARGVVAHYKFDDSARRTQATYSPDTKMLNSFLRETWNPAGIDFLGFVHSHPRGMWRPSTGDRVYAERILDALPAVDRLLLPIAQTRPDTGSFVLHPFVATRGRHGVKIDKVPLVTIRDEAVPATLTDPAFDRVHNAYDLVATASTRLVLVGVGGAASFAESMARAGIGEFVLIDPDIVDLPNIGTQQVYRRDLGRPKVDAVADRILDVNPNARVIGIQAHLDDLDDDMMRRLTHRPLPSSEQGGPATTILCGFTDNFWAQARVNRLALHLGVPMLAAQVYQQGKGVEVSFHVPGRSVACGRCVLGGRYRAHLERGYENTVTSHGTPLWATERLNELKAQVALAIIHGTSAVAKEDHPAVMRYASLLDRIVTRNLIQARLDPHIDLPAFTKAFADADTERLVSDETLWLPQEPENEQTGYAPCGDCGGTGDLTACTGSFDSTHVTRGSDWRSSRLDADCHMA
ncbi:ThiF family adenylyltransferase [Mycobacterium sp. ZZG]